jgi:anti-sigma factor RsiW
MAKQSSLSDEDRTNLVAYLDGELDEPAARALEAKLHLDPQARAEAEALKRTWELLDYLPRPEPSRDFTSRTLERVRVRRPAAARWGLPDRWRPWALGFGWAAAVLVAGALGFAGGRLLPHRQPAPAPDEADLDRHLVRDLRLLENLRLYEHVDDLPFLQDLADPNDPDLFGDADLES